MDGWMDGWQRSGWSIGMVARRNLLGSKHFRNCNSSCFDVPALNSGESKRSFYRWSQHRKIAILTDLPCAGCEGKVHERCLQSLSHSHFLRPDSLITLSDEPQPMNRSRGVRQAATPADRCRLAILPAVRRVDENKDLHILMNKTP
ncbi:uncharacterized protein LOC143328094 isoform X1 [Chaetodon auriga]|uniref:uncharacterized protein LOC143328094 isoform X1 n=1 Tax=Chaetodon auriga TaxID=39042 RepID=UPI0040330517